MTSAERRAADSAMRDMITLVDLQYDNEFAVAILKAQIEYVITLSALGTSNEIRVAMETLQSGVLVAERMLGLKP